MQTSRGMPRQDMNLLCNISGGDFPTDYESMMMGTSTTYDDDLEYLLESAVSLSQLFQSYNPHMQEEEQREETSNSVIDEMWSGIILSSEESFDPNFLENIDLESLDHDIVQDKGETKNVEDANLSASQVTEVKENPSLAELLADGPGVGISSETISVREEVQRKTSSLDVDEDLGYMVERGTIEEPDQKDPEFPNIFPATPPNSPEERSPASVTLLTVPPAPRVIVVNQTKFRQDSAPLPTGIVKVTVKKVSPSATKVWGGVKDQVGKKCQLSEEERAANNLLDRGRRQELKNAYEYVRDTIPAIAFNRKSSKQKILDSALDYCKDLACKLGRLERIQQEEVEKRSDLEDRLSRLQSEN